MNTAGPNTKEVKLLGNGGTKEAPRLSDGRTAPTRLITAGERAMLKAVEADAALRKSCPPPAKGKASEKDDDSHHLGWTRVVGHAY